MVDKVELLYSSKAVRARVRQLLAGPSKNDRRVVLVAYVGSAAQAYLPDPSGLLLVCNPSPGGTSARAVRDLMARGATVQFSHRLHMKVYWSEERGCVLTSANASANALGSGGLKEVGSYFQPGAVDIDALLDYAAPVKVTKEALRKLQMAARGLPSHLRPATDRGDSKSSNSRDYLRWWNSPTRSADPWKLGWWSTDLPFSMAAKAQAKTQYGVKAPFSFLGVAKGQAESDEWLLTFEVTDDGGIRKAEWLFVDFVVRVQKDDSEAFEPEFPFQAVQVFKRDKYTSPPFAITKEFRTSFRKAVQKYGAEALMSRQNLVPPGRLLRLTAENMVKKT